MKSALEVVESPDTALLDWLAGEYPGDVFCTREFATAQELLGRRTLLFKFADGGSPMSACLGFLKKGKMSAELEILSLPAIENEVFWSELLRFCQRRSVWDLSVRSFAGISIPVLGAVLERESGLSYQLRLEGQEAPVPSSLNLRRMIAKAGKAGVTVRRTQSTDDIAPHLGLMGASMDRRQARGESISQHSDSKYFVAMLKTGAAEFVQAVLDGVVLSSVFVLRSKEAAYYQSAGTSPEGMKVGASPFLIATMAGVYRQEGKKVFDLGGATEATPGLDRFKKGFGSEGHPFDSISCCVAHPVLRKLRTLIRLARDEPKALLDPLVSLTSYCVFRIDLASAVAGEPPQTELVKFSDDQLRALAASSPEFHRQSERMAEFGFNDAYGVYVDGALAHVSWLVTAEHDKLLPERELKLRQGEAEITHAYTAEAFRGKGIYPRAIQALCHRAKEMGIQKVYMSVHPGNSSSLKGVAKAGFQRVGRVFRAHSPLLSERFVLRFRGHRW